MAYSMEGSSLHDNFTFMIEDPSSIQDIKIAGWGNTSAKAEKKILPSTFDLRTYPNTFNPGCNIYFEVVVTGNISIKLYDINGKHVRYIMKDVLGKGSHEFYWEPKNISSGTYFIKITGDGHSHYKKILYLK